jgi:hypothetical protein
MLHKADNIFCRRLKTPITSTTGTMKQLTFFLAYDAHNIEQTLLQRKDLAREELTFV